MPILALLALLAAASGPAEPPAVAAPGGSSATSGAPPKTSGLDPEEVVCRTVMTTGTRFPTRDCRTRAKWDQLTLDSRDATARQQWAYGRPQ